MVPPSCTLTLVVVFLAHTTIHRTNGFAIYRNPIQSIRDPFPLRSSIADGSDYAADVEIEEAEDNPDWDVRKSFSEEDETPSIELQPVPMSKNAGNRFIALVWDRDFHEPGKDPLEMHEERIELSEDHVMFCRKQNLYNETFNTESMVDVVWSLQMYVSVSHCSHSCSSHIISPYHLPPANQTLLGFAPHNRACDVLGIHASRPCARASHS